MECQGRWDLGERGPAVEAVLCGPISVVGAEPGDVIVVDVLGIGRSDGRYAGAAHPGVIGCAPSPETIDAGFRDGGRVDAEGVLLGHVRPGLASYGKIVTEAVRTAARGRDIGGCTVAPLTPGSRILLPVHTEGAKLSVGDLHFPESEAEIMDCRSAAMAGWIDLRINLTERGVERFQISGPMSMPGRELAGSPFPP